MNKTNKFKIFVIAFFMLNCSISIAQNTFPTAAGTKAGIGTTSPNSSLEVRKVLSSTVTSNSALGIKGTSQYSYFNYGSGDHTYIRGGRDSSTVIMNDYSNAGPVLIGTATPNWHSKFQVSGGIGLTKTTYTDFNIAVNDWSGSHGLLFNCYKAPTQVSGGLGTYKNILYSNAVGAYSGGAGAIVYYGNGGVMDFLISDPASAINDFAIWQAPAIRLKRSNSWSFDRLVGINNDDPIANLHVKGRNGYTTAIFEGGTSTDNLGSVGIKIWNKSLFSNAYIDLIAWNVWNNTNHEVKYVLNNMRRGSDAQSVFTIQKYIDNQFIEDKLVIDDNKVWVKKLCVSSNGTCPDYVFEPDYNLMPLTDLENYVNTNKHLPNVPSASDIEKDGNNLDISKMTYVLLEKIEELTLYTIKQQQEIELLKEQINNQNNK